MGCDDSKQRQQVYRGKFQSTHPCGVRRLIFSAGAYDINISIHAPVWGATCDERYIEHFIDISIHAPVWGATYRAGRYEKE